mmetsp:Transcript_75859/g.148612  ORF Transcript_75859/g.148612 Transcript_75859/m.148612 type:complete len:434 (+) Transcript_75859:100-1401(+)
MKARVTRGGPTPSSRVPAPKASPRATPKASSKATPKENPKANPKAVAARTAAAASAHKMTGSNRRPPTSSHESGRFQRHTSDNLDYLTKEGEDDGTPAGNGGNSRGASDADGGTDLLATRSVSIDEFMRASDMVEKNLEALSQALDRSMNAPDLPRRPSVFSSSGSGARKSMHREMSEQTIAHVFSLRMRGEEQKSLGKAQGDTGDNGNAVDLDSPRPGSEEEGVSLTAAELKELGVVDLDGADDDDADEGGGEIGNATAAVAVAASKTNHCCSGNGIGGSKRPHLRNHATANEDLSSGGGCGATDGVNDEVDDEVESLKEKLKAAQEKVVLLEADNALLRTSLQSTEGKLAACETAREGAEGRCSTQQADLQKAQVLIRETLRQVWDLKNSARHHHRQSLPVSPGSADSTENPLMATQGDLSPAMPKPRILL